MGKNLMLKIGREWILEDTYETTSHRTVRRNKQFSQIKEKNSGLCKFQSVLMRYGNIESY